MENDRPGFQLRRSSLNYLFTKDWFKITLIVLGLILLSQVGAIGFRKEAYTQGQKLMKPLDGNFKKLYVSFHKNSVLSREQNLKLQTLLFIAESHKKHHKLVFLEMYRYHFASVTLLLMFSTILTILVFLVASDGWARSHKYLKTLFLSVTALTTFYGLSPVVYKQDYTISENQRMYVEFDNIESKIYNYAVIERRQTEHGTPLDFNKFHTDIVAAIAKINEINLQFDYKSIQVPSALEDIQ